LKYSTTAFPCVSQPQWLIYAQNQNTINISRLHSLLPLSFDYLRRSESCSQSCSFPWVTTGISVRFRSRPRQSLGTPPSVGERPC